LREALAEMRNRTEGEAVVPFLLDTEVFVQMELQGVLEMVEEGVVVMEIVPKTENMDTVGPGA
jgi:hypothetical protein